MRQITGLSRWFLPVLVAFIPFGVLAQSLHITPGLQSASSAVGWQLSNVTIATPASEQTAFVLVPVSSASADTRDLQLSITDGELSDTTGRWDVSREGVVDVVAAASARIGNSALSFVAPRGKLTLSPVRSELFMPGTVIGDFSIDFWLKPVRADNGEIVFLYRSTLQYGRQRFAQQMTASINRNRMNFAMFNFFIDPAGRETSISLQGRSLLVPGRWSHHLVRFSVDCGLFEYLMDGRLEAVSYVTSTGREGGTVFAPVAGASTRFDLAPNYTGLLDEFCLSNVYIDEPDIGRYSRAGGLVVSPVFDLGGPNTRLQRIDMAASIANEAAVHCSYRLADSSLGWTEMEPEWQAFLPGQSLAMAGAAEFPTGRYLQLRLDLYPDAARETTPTISALDVHFRLDDLPPAPAFVRAVAGDGRITVQWSAVSEADVRAYVVYYGISPGYYYGTGAIEGSSPIMVADVHATSLVLTGLRNGTLYFIVVAAMDSANPPQVGEFSQEVSARPSRTTQ